MAWATQAVAQPGQYVLARTVSGVSVDLFGSISNLDMIERLRNYANGWTPLSARIDRGLFSADVRVLGQVQVSIDTAAVADDVAGALNSFLSIAGASVSVWVSDNASAPEPAPERSDNTAASIRWIAVAAIAIAAAIVIVQVRKGIA